MTLRALESQSSSRGKVAELTDVRAAAADENPLTQSVI